MDNVILNSKSLHFEMDEIEKCSLASDVNQVGPPSGQSLGILCHDTIKFSCYGHGGGGGGLPQTL